MPDQAILVLNAYRYNLLNGRISPLFRKLSNEIDLQADILSAAYSRMIILLIIYIYIYIYDRYFIHIIQNYLRVQF